MPTAPDRPPRSPSVPVEPPSPSPPPPDPRRPLTEPRSHEADGTAPVLAAVALRPTATLRAASPPSRAEMAGRPTQLLVRPWDDALLDQFGHDPRSPYVERFWLGVLGPSATWMLRAFAHHFDHEPDGFTIDLRDTAKALGIGARGGANGALYRTLERVMSFGFAHYVDESTLAVRRRMGPLNRRQQQRLPEDLQLEHDAWIAANPARPTPSVDDTRRRARALALSLLELGEDLEATEHQLHRWRFHPAIAADSVRWAATVHEHRRAQAPTPAPAGPRSPGGPRSPAAADLAPSPTPPGGDAA